MTYVNMNGAGKYLARNYSDYLILQYGSLTSIAPFKIVYITIVQTATAADAHLFGSFWPGLKACMDIEPEAFNDV
eukprot:scaffold43192_cov42-Prasinocladus_malaysianus.AAC.2